MDDAAQAAVNKYGGLVAGLAIGTAAKYGLLLTEGRRLTLKGALIDMLFLGMLGFIALVFSDGLGLTGNAKVLAGALAAVSGDRLIRLVRESFLRSAENQMSRLLPPGDREAIMRVPAGSGDPDRIDVQLPPKTERDRMTSNLERAFGRNGKKPVPLDQIDLLRKLDGD